MRSDRSRAAISIRRSPSGSGLAVASRRTTFPCRRAGSRRDCGGGVLLLIASGKTGFDVAAWLASNGYGAHSPAATAAGGADHRDRDDHDVPAIILGATDNRAEASAPLPIGLGLTLIHLISIPVTNTSVNPARSTGVAVYVGDWAVGQLWLFWVAPIVGGLLGAVVYRLIRGKEA
jgi:aquaporin Z